MTTTSSAGTNGVLVDVDQVEKTFRRGSEEIHVLSGLNLDVPRGEFLALMGPSGSGKSTLLNLIGGLDRPTRGGVRVSGQDIDRMSDRQLAAWRAQHVGLVFQFYNLLNVLNAERNVELPLLLTHLNKSERKKHVATALDVVGLSHRAKHFPRQMSGGEQQRVGIARSIVTKPMLLIADEPTGNLDPRLAREVMQVFERFNQVGVSVLVATHAIDLIRQMKHRVVHLSHGRVHDDEMLGFAPPVPPRG